MLLKQIAVVLVTLVGASFTDDGLHLRSSDTDPLSTVPSIHDEGVHVPETCGGPVGTGGETPPVFGRRRDGWPRQVTGTGIVRELIPGYCGMFCLASQVRIEVATTTERYAAANLFAFAYCVRQRDLANYCGRSVRFRAEKILAGKPPCGTSKSFDSGGVPFYVIDDFHDDVVVLDQERMPNRRPGD